jgi:hypothetical protein
MGFNQELLALTILPPMLNTLSDATFAAGIH